MTHWVVTVLERFCFGFDALWRFRMSHWSRPHNRDLVAASLATLALVVAGCSTASEDKQGLPEQEQSAIQAARSAAEKAADGKQVGGSIDLLGVLSGEQLDAYLSTFAPFEEATGIDINYESTRDVNAVLQTRIAGGNPPDAVSNDSAGQMRALAEDGTLVALDDIVDTSAVTDDFPAGLIDSATVHGRLYGLFFNSSVNNLVWYDPQHYMGPRPAESLQELLQYSASEAAAGRTPFCIGLESGAASGWPGAGWIQQLMLTQSGPEAYDRWVAGDLPWTSPEVHRAFETFGSVATDPTMVAGGPTAVLTTSFDTSPQGLVAKDPVCTLHVQADFLGNLLASAVPGVKPVRDIDFFPFPAAEAGSENATITSGEVVGIFQDTPQTRALMRYVASPAFGTLVAGTGQWIAANQQTTVDAYTSPLSRKAAQLYADASLVRYSAQDAIPVELSQAFLKAVTGYVEDPSSLDDQLTKLDNLQAESR